MMGVCSQVEDDGGVDCWRDELEEVATGAEGDAETEVEVLGRERCTSFLDSGTLTSSEDCEFPIQECKREAVSLEKA